MKFRFEYFLVMAVILLYSCGGNENSGKTKNKDNRKNTVEVPNFNSDSAYAYIQKQVDFGPRVPGTEAHDACADYLTITLKRFTDSVYVQKYKARAYNGETLKGKNIIASFNPDNADRIFLCAHWDSRPYADHDENPEFHNTPIDGANDGASGVGVLLEIARQLSTNQPEVGIDIILFDLEDYGPPQDSQQRGEGDWWGLGSQYWSRNTHIPGYFAKYGILLDMVGAKDATFLMEGFSLYYAPGLLKKVWNTAHRIGYSQHFLFEQGGYIEDDHKYINDILKIPTIDIIHLDPNSTNGSFFYYLHTSTDNMDQISRQTLKAVGQTLLTVVFED